MEYNSQRSKLIIPEYGRYIQKMAEHACEIEDRETRNHAAQTIINLMSIMNPHFREEEDYMHKLWDHLHLISHFELEVDSPYPKPNPEEMKYRPNKLRYPKRKMKYAHYGNFIEAYINHAMTLPEGEEQDKLVEHCANMMKRAYLNYNRDSVNDDMIKEQLSVLSKGRLVFKDNQKLYSTNEILYSKGKLQPTVSQHSQGGGKKKKFHQNNRFQQGGGKKNKNR